MQENLQSTGGQDHSSPPVAADMLIVLCTFPDADTARRICSEIISANLAACVNIIPAVESIYRWQGKIEQASEVLAIFKIAAIGFKQFETELLEKHSYEIPEIIGIAPDQVSGEYLKWVLSER
ncbi:MAG: divalent-cation tolerance protein CutA [Akkermansiaceae bacterium]|jgi:periplasmic divalent cation tolerance protein